MCDLFQQLHWVQTSVRVRAIGKQAFQNARSLAIFCGVAGLILAACSQCAAAGRIVPVEVCMTKGEMKLLNTGKPVSISFITPSNCCIVSQLGEADMAVGVTIEAFAEGEVRFTLATSTSLFEYHVVVGTESKPVPNDGSSFKEITATPVKLDPHGYTTIELQSGKIATTHLDSSYCQTRVLGDPETMRGLIFVGREELGTAYVAAATSSQPPTLYRIEVSLARP